MIFYVENKLRYFVDAATLLGSIRQQMYIQWDDDIDVGIPHWDYDKFIKIFINEYDS
jgi:phosphorylcholine metabolism protein LicD